MVPVYLILALALGTATYFALHAISFLIPASMILLGMAGGLFWFSLHNPKGILGEEILSLLVWLVGGICGILGLALSPWPVQLISVIILLGWKWIYPLRVRA